MIEVLRSRENLMSLAVGRFWDWTRHQWDDPTW